MKRIAQKYLTSGRIVLSVVPPGQTDKASKASESRIVYSAHGGIR